MTRHEVDPDSDTDENAFDDARLGGREPSEMAPLLQRRTTLDISTDLEKERARLRPVVVIMAMVTIFLAELAVNVAVPAMNAVMEVIICNNLHPGATSGTSPGPGGFMESPPDSICKSEDVQSYLVMLRGWQGTFEVIPCILTSVAYGVMADRWGRRPVLLLAALGLNLQLLFTYGVFVLSNYVPIWVVLFANLFCFIGGGAMVAVAMLYTMLSDVVPVDQRSTVFFQFGATFLTAATISTPLSGFLMLHNIWLPLVVSWVSFTIINLISFLIPETVHLHAQTKEINRRSSGQVRDATDTVQDELIAEDTKTSTFEELKAKTVEGLTDVWKFILGNKKLGMLMLSLVFVVLGKLANELLLQYATKRYHWTWSEAAFLMTISGVTSMFTLLALLPAGGWLFHRYFGFTGVVKDIWLTRTTGLSLVFGCLVIALAPTGGVLAFGLVPYAFGSGLSPLIRSVLSALVEEHHIAMLNTLIGITESLGVIVASPLLAMSLSLGLKMGGGWIGLPFLIAALFATVVTTVAWTFRPPRDVKEPAAEP